MEFRFRNVIGGEDVGGIFKSTDAGGTWKKLGGGLPGQPGRIGLAVSASDPKVVMAVVQSYEGGIGALNDLRSKSGGVFRSTDGGETWTTTEKRAPLWARVVAGAPLIQSHWLPKALYEGTHSVSHVIG